MVIVESGLSHRIFRNQIDASAHVDLDDITLGLGKAASVVLFAYFFLKIQALADSGAWSLLNTSYGYWYLVEVVGFVLLPCFLLARAVRQGNAALVRAGAAVAVAGVVLNRLNVSVVAMNWNAGVRYVPSWMEVVTSMAVITIGVLTFRFIVNRMPVLHQHPAYEPH